MFEIKKRAVDKITELIKGAKEEVNLRISIERGCCSDSINMELVKEKKPGDIEIENSGMKYYLSEDAARTLDKGWMDADENGNIFIEGIGPRPGSCGCGENEGGDCCGGHEHGDDCCGGNSGGCCEK